ncbi:MAG: purple acid phosphatase family protein [Promethearchaeota archaeon]
MKLPHKRIFFIKLMVLIIIFSITFIHIFVAPNINSIYINNITHNLEDNIKSSDPLTPTGIRITSVNDSSNSMVITWYTTEAASDPKVIYSNEPTFSDSVTIVPTSITIDSMYIYGANLKNLESDTTYYYNISSDSSNKREMLNFTTTPIRNTTSLKFLVYGDSRSQQEERTELTKKIMQNFDDIKFLVHTGDIINDGTNQTLWNNYFNDVEIITKKIPGFYIEGNHEAQSQKMYDNIPLPSNGINSRYYNFSIGPISFIGLNTERDISEQTTWLEKTLKFIDQDNDTLWKIVYMHQPIFNSRYSRTDRTDLIATWCPLFEKYDIDFIFAGHNHYYERSYPMNTFKEYDDSEHYNFMNPKELMYFITGGAGAPLYDRDDGYPFYEPPSYTAHYNSTYHFIIAEVIVDDVKEETNFTLETWAMPEDYSGLYLIDNITIVKKGAFINIHSPHTNQLIGKVAPKFNVSIDKVKLKPTWFNLNASWYSIDDGNTNFTYIGSIGKINQTAWDLRPNGTVNIQFYASNFLGNIINNSVTVRKDIELPRISILNPGPNQLFGKSAPTFSLLIDMLNLNLTWYTIDDGKTNFTFSGGTGILNQTAWDSHKDGIVKLIFYANDSVGNLNSSEILIQKDATPPNITIIFPIVNMTFGIGAPNFTVIVKDEHLDSMWYCFNESLKKIFFNNNSTISQDEWDKLSNGLFILIFFANDCAGNLAFKEIIIIKNVDEAIDNTNNRNFVVLIGALISLIIILTISLISTVYIELKRKKLTKFKRN